MHEEVLCQNVYIIIDTQQIEGKPTDESSLHYCVYIWLERIKVRAGKYVGRSEFEEHVIHVNAYLVR